MSLRNAHSLFRTVNVPANSLVHQDITGRFLFIKSATDKFKLTVDEGTEFELEAGDRLEMPLIDGKQSTFNKLTFRNPTSTQITITFHAGTIIVSTGTPYVFTRPAPTYIVPFTGTLGDSVTFNIPNTNTRAGQPYPETQARLIISAVMSGGGTSAALDLMKGGTAIGRISLDSNGNSLPWVVETSDAITIAGYSAVIGYRVAAFYNYNA